MEKMRDLYRSDKYKVLLGKGRAGLCTAWTDPELVFGVDGISEKVSIVGSLYSAEGVNIIIRNLGLNPDIDSLYLLENSPLSKTKYGRSGTDVMKRVWKGDFSGLHKEFDEEGLKKIISRVKLIELKDTDMHKLNELLEASGARIIGEKISFAEHKSEHVEALPSEIVGFRVGGKTIVDAWLRVVDKIMRYGIPKETESGEMQKELVDVTWVISEEDTKKPRIPSWPESIRENIGLVESGLKEYLSCFMSPVLPEGVSYTYGSRLWNFTLGHTEEGINQINQIIDHLKKSHVTRRAVASTWNIGKDADKETSNPPCFVMIQFVQTKGQLHAIAIFRSHDIFKAAIPNAFGLRKLHEHIAKETGFELGTLAINSISAHIYEKDWEEAKRLLKCRVWENETEKKYDPEEDGVDPRGMIRISTSEDKIIAVIHDREGNELFRFDSVSAEKIARKMSKLDLLSMGGHWIDIGMELSKAEMCIKTGKHYEQDKPIEYLLR